MNEFYAHAKESPNPPRDVCSINTCSVFDMFCKTMSELNRCWLIILLMTTCDFQKNWLVSIDMFTLNIQCYAEEVVAHHKDEDHNNSLIMDIELQPES